MTAEPLPMAAGDPARAATIAGSGGAARGLVILVGAVVVSCAAIGAWLIFTPKDGGREPGRTYTVWHASMAVAAYDRLYQAIVTGHTANGATPAEIGTLAENFVQSVLWLHESDQIPEAGADPAINALVRRLDTDRKQLPALLGQLSDPGLAQLGTRPVTGDTSELARLTEAVNQESAAIAESDKDGSTRQRWLAVAIIGALTAVCMVLTGILARAGRRGHAMRQMLDDAEFRLREALATAGRADTAKSRFIATARHDLRAPVDAVMSLADSLLDERLPPMQREITGKIRDAGGSLLRALDDVMDYTTLETDELTLDECAFSPEALAAAAVTGIEAQARAKGLTVVAIPAPGLPKSLLGDPGRIGRILSRLASNAVKFTEKGGISLQVLCVERVYEHATIEWVVTDTGAGIDPVRLDRLFGPDALSADAAADLHTGDDLGLAVCRRLVSRMGGSMRVESAVGEGSRFRVRLPFRVAPAAAPKPTAPPSALREQMRAMGRRPKLLMAEDTPAGQFILRQLLAREGIAPEMVGDGRAAVMAAEADRFDVICMDLRMPEMDGFEATRRIRAGRGPSARTPIIAVTASTSPADIQACRDAGMTMFVGKPVRREALMNAILAALTGQNDGSVESPERRVPRATNQDFLHSG